MGFPGSSDSKESACNAGDPGLGWSPGEGNNYTCRWVSFSFFSIISYYKILNQYLCFWYPVPYASSCPQGTNTYIYLHMLKSTFFFISWIFTLVIWGRIILNYRWKTGWWYWGFITHTQGEKVTGQLWGTQHLCPLTFRLFSSLSLIVLPLHHISCFFFVSTREFCWKTNWQNDSSRDQSLTT